MEKVIGIIAGIAGIIGAGVAVYSQFTGQEPNQQLTIFMNDEQRRHDELIGVLKEIARKDFNLPTPLNEGTKSTGEPPLTETDITKAKVSSACVISDADNEVMVGAINVRSGPAQFSSLASWIGILAQGDKVKVIDSEASGIFGLGTIWVKIEYCDKEIKRGWISTKLEGGDSTLRPVES